MLSRPAHRGDLAGVALGLWGGRAVRAAASRDDVDGLTPQLILEPIDREMLGAMLRWASLDGLRLIVRGGGTKLTWGSPATAVDAVLSTAGMSSEVDHHAGDLTATIGAGTPLAAASTVLRRGGQWLPLDPPHAGATIGGIVATNDSGPRRNRFGTPRDLVIGVEVALADGRFAKGGGRVVKNVAGYDLARLMCGSFGTLGVIANATFKLSPIPEASRTVVAALDDPARLAELGAAVGASQLAPSAIELELWPGRLLVRFETIEEAARQQSKAAVVLCEQFGARATTIEGNAELILWRDHVSRTLASTAVVRVGVVPADAGHTLSTIARAATEAGTTWSVRGRAALGVLVVHLDGDAEDCASVITRLRQALAPTQGRVAIVAAELKLRTMIDAWGPVGDGLPIMQALKRAFDPRGILNPGRGPGGL